MGILDSVKGSANAWGVVTADFLEGFANIGPAKLIDNRDHTLMITNANLKEPILFTKEDVQEVKTLFATSEWIKYRITLKDGKCFIATFMTLRTTKNGRDVSLGLLNFEWWLAGLIYN